MCTIMATSHSFRPPLARKGTGEAFIPSGRDDVLSASAETFIPVWVR